MEFWAGRYKDGRLGVRLRGEKIERRTCRSLELKLERLESRVVLSADTWTGHDAATNNNWSDANNWQPMAVPAAGDTLTFPTGLMGPALTSNNDLTAGTSFGGLTIKDTGYTITGHAIAMTGTIEASQTSAAGST